MTVTLPGATQLSRDSAGPTRATGLPPALVAQSARRLRLLALQYAFIFFMSDPLLAIPFPDERAAFLASPPRCAPSMLSVTPALPITTLTSSNPIAMALALDTAPRVVRDGR